MNDTALEARLASEGLPTARTGHIGHLAETLDGRTRPGAGGHCMKLLRAIDRQAA